MVLSKLMYFVCISGLDTLYSPDLALGDIFWKEKKCIYSSTSMFASVIYLYIKYCMKNNNTTSMSTGFHTNFQTPV